MYKHVSERFKEENIPLPYETFHADINKRRFLEDVLNSVTFVLNMSLEACGEPGLATTSGCISQKDIDILGLTDEIILSGNSDQRDSCLCPANKRQLIKGKPGRCSNNCLYCFWF